MVIAIYRKWSFSRVLVVRQNSILMSVNIHIGKIPSENWILGLSSTIKNVFIVSNESQPEGVK